MNHANVRKCQACQVCRSRKVKCDGKRPRCTLCQTQHRQCQYGEDRRQTARISKNTVQLLDRKVANLEQIISQLSQKGLANRENAIDEDIRLADHSIEPNPGPQLLADAESDEADLLLSQNSNEAETSEMNAMVQSETGLSFHGATSSFRKPESQPSPSVHSDKRRLAVSAPDRQLKIHEWKKHLFANSALERQKEHAYMVNRSFELDGLDVDTAFRLLNFYWNHQHNTYLVTYRPSIMHSLATGGIYANRLLLNAIYYTGASQCGDSSLMEDPSDPQTLGNRFFNRFQALLATEIQQSSIANISALIVMGSTLLARGRPTLGWLYCGIAYRMIVDLGLHVNPEKIQLSSLTPRADSSYTLTATDIELQRRVFWGAYMNDRFQSLYYGRAPALSLIPGREPPQKLLDTYDELELWSPYVDPPLDQPYSLYSPQPKYNVTNRDSLLRLAEISSDIIEKFYTSRVNVLSPEAAWKEVSSTQARLDDWLERLPEHLRYDPAKDPTPPPHRFYPHTTFHTLTILLYRPYLCEGNLGKIAIDEDAIKQKCVSSATQIYSLAQAYRDAFTLRRAPYLFSYALFSAATVIPLHWQNSPSRLSVIMFFWNALKELQKGTNIGLKKPIMIIRDMFERAGLDLAALSTLHENMRVNRAAQPAVEAGINGTEQSLSYDPDIDLLGSEDCQDLCQGLLTENFDCFATVDDMDMSQQTEMLYGLFGPPAEFHYHQ